MKKTLLIALAALSIQSCSNRLAKLQDSPVAPQVNYSNKKHDSVVLSRDSSSNTAKSIIYVDKEGKEQIFSEAVKDALTGEMMAQYRLDEVIVSAKSHNIAERNGAIKLDFVVTIPSDLQKSDWQVDMLPVLTYRDMDTINFKRILVSGADFKKNQERGYKRFEKYLKSIIPDDANYIEVFADLPNLKIFLERHLPESRIIEGEENDDLETAFGVKEKKIVEHYINRWLIERNEKKKANRSKMYAKYIKNPRINGVMLDSVIRNNKGNFEYHYSQELIADSRTTKLYLNILSQIRDCSGNIVTLPTSDTIVYNVSSITHFVDRTTRYKKKIIERKVNTTTSAAIDFEAGKWDINVSLANNTPELERLKEVINGILQNDVFELDTISITASCSPEGSFNQNKLLSAKRAESMKQYFSKYIDELQQNNAVIVRNLGGDSELNLIKQRKSKILSKNIPEDWEQLKQLIVEDNFIVNKTEILNCLSTADPDVRELKIKNYKSDYDYIKSNLYPSLRRVKLEFKLTRKGMVKDTIHSNEVDSTYMQSLDLLSKRDYENALSILKEYQDINTALAHISLGHNFSALEILERNEDSAVKNYLLAIIAARQNREDDAVKYFLRSKELDRRMSFRGGLDPEISHLIRKYNLNKDMFE